LRNRHVASGLLLALGVLAVTARGEASSRLEWQPDACRLSWHRNCSFSPGFGSAGTSTAHRFVTLEAQFRSFSASDAAVYAVYLADRRDLDALRASLRQPGAPRPWETNGHAPSTDPVLGRLACEWISVLPNGRLTVHVDEANQTGKSWVAVVNSEGEILGVHPLWAGGDIAAVR